MVAFMVIEQCIARVYALNLSCIRKLNGLLQRDEALFQGFPSGIVNELSKEEVCLCRMLSMWMKKQF